jgi:hypothetical protein
MTLLQRNSLNDGLNCFAQQIQSFDHSHSTKGLYVWPFALIVASGHQGKRLRENP